MKTNWDYSDRAHTYDMRADYSQSGVNTILSRINIKPNSVIADIGAGTGKLTKILAQDGRRVYAVEPNANMRRYGVENTKHLDVQWSEGVGEATTLKDHSVDASFFGSSFNVVDQNLALNEVKRITNAGGWFVCMWNHRDLNDPIQSEIEKIILSYIPDYNYGLRRQSPKEVIDNSDLFFDVHSYEDLFSVQMVREDIIDAWRSHDTLYRQAADKFDDIINSISDFLTSPIYPVPYYTRIWYAQLK